MDWPVFFPNVKIKSTKDLIIRLLTKKKEMTNQSLFLQIKKQYGISVTYQAVRQALTELTVANVLVKNQKYYSISTKWIKTLDDFSNLLKKKYVENFDIKLIDEKTKEIELNSLYDLGHFILYSFNDHFFDINKKRDLFMFVHNLWFPFFDNRKRQLLRDFFSQNKNFIFTKNKGIVNRVFGVFYKKFGKVKLGIKFDNFFDIIIQGDCVVKIYMPKDLRNKMNKLYKSRNPFNFKILNEFSDVTYSNYPIKLIITRDKLMAKEMKEKLRKKI